MENLTAADWANSNGIGPAGQVFVQRWLELFHRLTIDTYRVRHLNARLAVVELANVIRDAQVFGVDPLNIKEIAAETLLLLQEDPVAQTVLPRAKHYYASLAQPLLDGKTVHPGLPVLIDHILPTLNQAYRPRLIQALRAAINDNDIDQTIAVTSRLASDLIGEGHDLRHLYWRGQLFTRPPARPFAQKLDETLNAFGGLAESQYSIVFRLEFNNSTAANDAPPLMAGIQLTPAVPEAQTPAAEQFTPTRARFRYARLNVSALDPFSAARRAAADVARALDLVQFTRPSIRIYSPPAALILAPGNQLVVSLTLELLGPIRIASEGLNARHAQLTTIRNSDIDPAIKNRLSLGLQYLRRGFTDPSPAGQFLNFWIGLEAVVGGAGRTNVGDMRRQASRLIAAGYARRILGDLRQNLRRLDINLGAALNTTILNEHNASNRLVALANALRDEGTRPDLVAASASSPLLQHRIGSVAALVSQWPALRQALLRNEQDVMWHVQRMYRIRNAIVHGGFVPEDLTHINSHVATYLWACLRVLIEELARGVLRDIKDVFEKFSWTLSEHHRLAQEQPGSIPTYLSLVQPQTLFPA
jgi:hypothetical protein